MHTRDRQQLISGEVVRPILPGEYSASWEEEMISDYSFAAAADALMEEGRSDEALQLAKRGVAAHSLYTTGHIVLARVYIVQKSWEAAFEPLERALKLDGPTPALLEMLAMCYDETGQIDLALESRSLGSDLDMRPLTEEEHEGGPEMVDERADDLEPGDEIVEQPDEPRSDIVKELDNTGNPDDALKELEALLDGTGSSAEGDEDGTDLEETPVESGELEATDDEADTADSKDDIWKKIMEQADTVEEAGYSGMEDIESLISESDTEPVADLEPDVDPVADLESDVDPVADLEPEAELVEATVEAETADSPELKPVGTWPIEDSGDKEEVSPVEGLETGTSDDAIEDLPYSEASGDEEELPGEEKGEIASVLGDEEMVAGPVELSEETIKEAAGGLELDGGYDVKAPDETASAEADADATDPSSDVEAALQALENDLDMQSDEAAATEQPEKMGMEDDSVGLEDMALDEIAMEEAEVAGEEKGEVKEEGEEELPFAAGEESEELSAEGGVIQIKDIEDSIKLAIQAEILVAKGHSSEAIKMLEALHLWEPDRTSYKERLEELRRLQE